MGAYEHIKVNSSLGPVGAEVSGVDLSQPLSPGVVREIHAAWLKHHVLFFHDQDMSPAAQVQFSANFGELDQYKFMQAVDETPTLSHHQRSRCENEFWRRLAHRQFVSGHSTKGHCAVRGRGA